MLQNNFSKELVCVVSLFVCVVALFVCLSLGASSGALLRGSDACLLLCPLQGVFSLFLFLFACLFECLIVYLLVSLFICFVHLSC